MSTLRKLIGPLALVGAGLVALRYTRLASAGAQLGFYVQRVKVRNISLSGIKLELECVVQNPSGSTIQVDYLAADLIVSGTTVARIGDKDIAALRKKYPEYFKVPPETDQDVAIGVNLSPAMVAKVALKWITNGVPSKATVTGKAKVAGVQVPIQSDVPLAE